MAIICMKFNQATIDHVFSMGGDVVLVLDRFDRDRKVLNDHCIARAVRVFDIDSIDSVEEISSLFIELQAMRIDVDYVLSGSEYGMFARGVLLGLLQKETSPMKLAVACRDKRYMKKLFGDAGLRSARFVSDYRGGALDDISFPAVVKPSAGTGSYNTMKVLNNHELDSFVADSRFHAALKAHQWTVEEFIHGEEHHADIVWRDGHPIFISIGVYLTPRLLIGLNPHLNASYILSPTENAALFEEVVASMSAVCTIIGIRNGITHSEFF